MTPDEAQEYGRLVKSLDVIVLRVPWPVWPLCDPAVRLVEEVERRQPYACKLCGLWKGHRCACPVSTLRKGLRLRLGGVPCR